MPERERLSTEENVLQDKLIAVIVTGGIAAFKAASLVSLLRKNGAEVQVVMTEDAEKLVGPTTFQALSGRPVWDDLYASEDGKIRHVELSRRADLLAVVPTTLNTVGKLASGLADNLATATLAATEKPVLLCPSMDHQMYDNPAHRENLDLLRRRGFFILEPSQGRLASGRKGKGRLPEPEEIFDRIVDLLSQRGALKGKSLLITAGPTVEPIDPMRYLSNRSSGRMGYSIAERGQEMGGEISLISGPVSLSPPSGVGVVQVETAQEMEEATLEEFKGKDMVIMAAAVSDWRPKEKAREKIKKEGKKQMELQLTRNPDILKKIGGEKGTGQILVGFAAESEEMEKNAVEKLEKKNLDAIFVNPIGEEKLGPDSSLNRGSLIFRSGDKVDFPPQNKETLARDLLLELAKRFFPEHGRENER